MKTKFFRLLLPALLAVGALCGIGPPSAHAQPTLDFGDAPPPYPTLVNNNGARHTVVTAIRLGGIIDAELDGQPNSTATGDDTTPPTADDEDGVTLPATLIAGQAATIQVQASVNGFLNAWLDFNGDGDWADAGEQIFVNNALTAGINNRLVNVPITARLGNTFARFRFTTNAITGLSFVGAVNHGEVEDYLVRIGGLDFGDAPTSNYPTTLAQDGARHVIDPTFFLGSLIDAEPDGQPTSDASGDDVNPATADDEDGIVFLDPLSPGGTVRVQVTATIPAGQSGRLDAFVDFNADGDWLDSGEQIFTAVLVNGGVNPLLTFVVPPNAVSAQTFARFRLSRQGGLRSSSLAQDGEVEDYRVQIGDVDFGDAPQNYPTLLAQNGARHLIDRTFVLGTKIDGEPDGQPNANATGDDINPSASDDEDGITFVSPLVPGQPATIDIMCTIGPGVGRVDAWIDYNGSGSWADPGEQILLNAPVLNGVNTFVISVPAAAQPGTKFARFRLSREGNLKFDGPAPEGEVEDYQVAVNAAFDFGDAPDPTYPTLLANNGARHTVVSNFCLGTKIDTEADGQPNATATGDDIIPSSSDDEDGVTFISPLVPGGTVTVQVVATIPVGTSGFLNAWMDFNGNGSWAEAVEQIFTAVPLANGPNTLNFNIPAGTKAGTTFARFRLSRQSVTRYDGFGQDGEVEDYLVTVQEGMDFGDAPETTGAISYPTTLARNGARHIIVQGFHMGELEDAEPNGQPTSNADGDDINPPTADDEDGVTGSGPLVQGHNYTVHVFAVGAALSPAYVNAWVDFNGNNSWADPGEQILAGVPVINGDNALTFAVPATAKTGTTFARFRYSHQKDLPFDGPAPDGEVEDYEVPIINDRDRCDLSCEGTDFWLTFPGNYAPDPDRPVRPSLCIVGAAGVTGTVAIPGLGFTTNFTIPAALAVSVPLPTAADLGDLNDSVTNKGIHVTASSDVAIYAISKVKYTSDSYLALHTSLLGTEYIVMGWSNIHAAVPPLNGSQFAIVACESNTAVTITPSHTAVGHPKGVPYNLILQPGDTYQLRGTNDTHVDLTGTVITSDKPIAVFGSHQCANMPTTNEWFCDYLVEQLPPVNEWGMNFITAPLATRTGGDTYRCLASEDNTALSLDGLFVKALNRGEYQQFSFAAGHRISADKPILVAQYANSADHDPPAGSFNQGDPFMSIVQATRHYENSYTLCSFTNGFPANYLNVITPVGTEAAVTLNGAAIGAGAFTTIAGSGYAFAQVTVTAARNTVAGPAPLAVSAYGWAEYESYGHPACFHVGDARPPTITCSVTNVTVTLQGSAAANCFAQVPDFRQFVTADDNCSGRQGVTIRQTPDPGTPLGPGVHPITITAQDTSGNKATCVVTFTVIDPSPVNIFCPSNITKFCTSGQGAVVQFPVTARSTCDTNVPVVCTPPSGSLFPVGTTPVVCQATSLAGQTASCTFTVEVRCGGKLSVSVSNNTLTVTWTGSPGTLERASTLDGRWTPVISGVNSYTAPFSGSQAFFRVQY